MNKGAHKSAMDIISRYQLEISCVMFCLHKSGMSSQSDISDEAVCRVPMINLLLRYRSRQKSDISKTWQF